MFIPILIKNTITTMIVQNSKKYLGKKLYTHRVGQGNYCHCFKKENMAAEITETLLQFVF